MSSSPTVSNASDNPLKRRRTSGTDMTESNPAPDNTPAAQSPQAHIPKRGARACTSCRKGKNRCEGEPPCRRCQLNGTPCIFEKPEKKNTQVLSSASVERLSRLEGQYLVLQSQMIGMQSSLDRILSVVQTQSQANAGISQQGPFYPSNVGQGPGVNRDTAVYVSTQRNGFDVVSDGQSRRFPSLSGFVPPPHKYTTYGNDPSAAQSSEDDDTEDNLPRPSMNPPIEALQDLANVAAEAAAVPSASSPKSKKRKKADLVPRNAFPHVVEKGLVSENEAKELYHIFFAGCHLFIPLFDPSYDTYQSLTERSPWVFDAILAVAAKVRAGNGPPNATFFKCLEEAQTIARSSLFGTVVQKEDVQGMLVLAAWGGNGWLPSGHAMRMALDLGLHHALEKLANNSSKPRTEEEERDLVVSARIWLCLYWFDHQMSLGTGKPIILRDESSVRHCRLLLTHPMTSPTDVRLIAQVELIAQKTQIYETLATSIGQVNHNTQAFFRRANVALDNWWADCDELHRKTMDEDSLLRKILVCELHYAKLWVICAALRGVSWDKMPFEQRELAFQAKDSAFNCLSIFLTSSEYRAALRYAAHDSLGTAAFSGLFLLKMACLFPAELDLSVTISQIEQLAQLLSDVSAERYALAVRIMLANLRRRTSGGMGAPAALPAMSDGVIMPSAAAPTFMDSGSGSAPFTMEELGFAWPSDRGVLRPSSIPPWLREEHLADLGIPDNGPDGMFSQLTGVNGWSGDAVLA